MATEKEIPLFKTSTPFFDGVQLHPGGTDLSWQVPEEWNEKVNGPHPMGFGPSQTFIPLNESAKKLQAEHAAKIAKLNTPKPSMDEEAKARFSKLEEMFLKIMEQNLAIQADLRRKAAAEEEAEEEKKKGKK